MTSDPHNKVSEGDHFHHPHFTNKKTEPQSNGTAAEWGRGSLSQHCELSERLPQVLALGRPYRAGITVIRVSLVTPAGGPHLRPWES